MNFIPCEDCALRRLALFKKFTAPELSFVRALKNNQIDVPARRVIIEPGRFAGKLYTLYAGWAFRYKLTPTGQRQITDILLPGNLIGLQQLMLGDSESGVESLTRVTLCVLTGRSINELFQRHSHLSEAMVLVLMEEQRRADRRMALVAKQIGAERLGHRLINRIQILAEASLTRAR